MTPTTERERIVELGRRLDALEAQATTEAARQYLSGFERGLRRRAVGWEHFDGPPVEIAGLKPSDPMREGYHDGLALADPRPPATEVTS